MNKEFLYEDFQRIMLALEEFDGLLSYIWYIGKPRFVENTDFGTACVAYNERTNQIEFLYDIEFYTNNDFYTNLFFTSHEILHCVLDHLTRVKDLKNKRAANMAADIVVHNSLIDSFGFERKRVNNWEKFCWHDKMGLPKGLSLEEYYELLKDNVEDYKELVSCDISGLSDDQIKQIMEKLGNAISDEVDNKTKNEFLGKIKRSIKQVRDAQKNAKQQGNKPDGQQAGTQKGETAFILSCKRPKLSETWKKFLQMEIRKILHKRKIEGFEHEVERWEGKQKRLQLMPEDVFLPYEHEREDFHVDIVFFLDTSGSCIGYKEQFFNTLLSVPTRVPNATIKIDAWSFDTDIYKVDVKKGEIFGGGGTSFHIMEDHIKKTYKRYPKLVCVITDGYGDNINPEKPQNWRWFLTRGGSTSCLPKDSKTFEYEKFRAAD